MSINKAIISGNLTRDAELRSTTSGTAVLTIGVAVNDRRRNPQTGDWEDYANYIDCVMFGSRAQAIANYLTRGTKVAIEGKLRWRQWESDGQKRSKIEVVIDEIEFMTSREGGNGGQPRQSAQQGGYNGGYSGGSASIPAAPEISVYDEDVPF